MRKEGTPSSIFYVADVVCKGFVTDRLVNNIFKLLQESGQMIAFTLLQKTLGTQALPCLFLLTA